MLMINFAKKLKDQHGFNLIELMVSLVILSILTAPFLGMMVQFSKVNKMSQTTLLAGLTANNEYERLKSLTVPELAQLSINGIRQMDSFYLKTEISSYQPGLIAGNKDSIDLIIKDGLNNDFLCYLSTPDLPGLTLLRGTGSVNISLALNENIMTFNIMDEGGHSESTNIEVIESQKPYILNLYTQKIPEDLRVDFTIDGLLKRNLKINLYEKPLQYGNTYFYYDNQKFQSDQQLKPLTLGSKISIHTIKIDQKTPILLYAQVKVYKSLTDNDPINIRQGILQADN